MTDVAGFFMTPQARRLDDRRNQPPDIELFLDHERRAVMSLLPRLDLLIETACGDGRYLETADAAGVRYLGVDPSPEAIEHGRRALERAVLRRGDHRFAHGTIEALDDALAPADRRVDPARSLVLLPFSIMSALPDLDAAAAALARAGRPFLATMYATTPRATRARVEYYRRCGLDGIAVHEGPEGVRLTTRDGLATTAYRPIGLTPLWVRHGLDVRVTHVGDVFTAFRGEVAGGRRGLGG